MSAIQAKLQLLGIALPPVSKPVAAYVPAVLAGNTAYVSGQVPFAGSGNNRKLLATGPVPSKVSVEAAQDAARQCALNGLAALSDVLNADLDRVERILRLGVFVCSDPGFAEQPKVANGASELLMQVFGEAGRHARAAVGSVALPLGATVEVEMTVAIR